MLPAPASSLAVHALKARAFASRCASGGVWMSACSTAFKKQVLPRLSKPTPWGRRRGWREAGWVVPLPARGEVQRTGRRQEWLEDVI